MKHTHTFSSFLNEARVAATDKIVIPESVVNEAMQIKKGDFVRYKKDEEFTGGKVLNISSGKAEIHNWDGSTIELPVADLEYIESWNR